MQTLTESGALVDPVAPYSSFLEGYDQDTVDDFLRAVDEEKARLRAEIEDAQRRERRALALLHMHETMLVTLREAYEEVTLTRRMAEAKARAIVEDAARRAGQLDHGGVRP